MIARITHLFSQIEDFHNAIGAGYDALEALDYKQAQYYASAASTYVSHIQTMADTIRDQRVTAPSTSLAWVRDESEERIADFTTAVADLRATIKSYVTDEPF